MRITFRFWILLCANTFILNAQAKEITRDVKCSDLGSILSAALDNHPFETRLDANFVRKVRYVTLAHLLGFDPTNIFGFSKNILILQSDLEQWVEVSEARAARIIKDYMSQDGRRACGELLAALDFVNDARAEVAPIYQSLKLSDLEVSGQIESPIWNQPPGDAHERRRRTTAQARYNYRILRSAGMSSADALKRIKEQGRRELGSKNESILANGAINFVLAALDPHSSYFPPIDLNKFENEMRGGVPGGIGIQFSEIPGHGRIEVTDVVPGGPADGVLFVGDQVVAVDGEKIHGAAVPVRERIIGTKGTSVTLTVDRGEGEVDVALVRTDIDSRPLMVKGFIRHEGVKVGVIRFDRFFSRSEEFFWEKLQELRDQGIEALVIDIRDNSGGDMAAATGIVGSFVKNGPLVGQVFRRGGGWVKDEDEKATRSRFIPDLPIAVLVDSGSASASEILAGSLQAYRRAVVVSADSQTFGKGSFQMILPEKEVSIPQGALKMTLGFYYLPNGKSPQWTGVKPDVVIPIRRPFDHFAFLERDLPASRTAPDMHPQIEISEEAEAQFRSKVRFLKKHLSPAPVSVRPGVDYVLNETVRLMGTLAKEDENTIESRKRSLPLRGVAPVLRLDSQP